MKLLGFFLAMSSLAWAQAPPGLGQVRVVYVDDLGGADAGSIRDMIIGAIHRTGLFVVTENAEAADAVLRGSAEDLIFQDYQRYRESLSARGAASASNRETGESRFRSSSFGVGDSEESSSRERKHEALAAVRLVLRDGTVVWSTTQESDGAKLRGAAAHVADKVAEDLEKAVRAVRGSAVAN
ncbi:MAG: hypothetical protein R2748_26815 [Bryobacterales bacterium]